MALYLAKELKGASCYGCVVVYESKRVVEESLSEIGRKL